MSGGSLKNQNLIISEISKTILEEISFLKTYYPYKLQSFYSDKLLYGSAFLAFFNIEEIKNFDLSKKHELNNYADDKEKNIIIFDTNKIINLITGIELLATGLKIHASCNNFFENKSDCQNGKGKESEKNSIAELLFGDIFYSRAISYLITLNDFAIFDNILKSLLSVHKARIIIHKKIKDSITDSSEFFWFFNNGFSEIKMFNSLLKEIFFTGIGLSNFDISKKITKDFLIIINEMIVLKTYNELIEHFTQEASKVFLKNNRYVPDFFYQKTESIKKNLKIKINKLQPGWIKENFLKLFLIFL